MSDTVWLDRCKVRVRQPTLAKFVCTFETVSWLVREGFATTTRTTWSCCTRWRRRLASLSQR